MIELNDALVHALNVKSFLVPYCTRIEIAGSVRREKPNVKDLEIICIPKMIPSADLFRENAGYSALEGAPFGDLGKVIKNGSRYKQIDLGEIILDLFIVFPPAEFGVLFAIRTGDKFFSHWLVTNEERSAYSEETKKFYKGALPYFAKVENGGVYENGLLKSMPEESDFLEYTIGMKYLSPKERDELFVEHFCRERKLK